MRRQRTGKSKAIAKLQGGLLFAVVFYMLIWGLTIRFANSHGPFGTGLPSPWEWSIDKTWVPCPGVVVNTEYSVRSDLAERRTYLWYGFGKKQVGCKVIEPSPYYQTFPIP